MQNHRKFMEIFFESIFGSSHRIYYDASVLLLNSLFCQKLIHICIYIHTGIVDLVSQIRLSRELKCSKILNDLSLRICKNMKLILYKYS